MANPDTHRAQAKSLFKKGLITEKQHDRMLAKLAAMVPVAAPTSQGGAGPDPQMASAVTPAQAASLPATVSVPGDKSSSDSAPASSAVQPPSA